MKSLSVSRSNDIPARVPTDLRCKALRSWRISWVCSCCNRSWKHSGSSPSPKLAPARCCAPIALAADWVLTARAGSRAASRLVIWLRLNRFSLWRKLRASSETYGPRPGVRKVNWHRCRWMRAASPNTVDPLGLTGVCSSAMRSMKTASKSAVERMIRTPSCAFPARSLCQTSGSLAFPELDGLSLEMFRIVIAAS